MAVEGVAIDRVLFVHGYSVRELSAYGQFPAFMPAPTP